MGSTQSIEILYAFVVSVALPEEERISFRGLPMDFSSGLTNKRLGPGLSLHQKLGSRNALVRNEISYCRNVTSRSYQAKVRRRLTEEWLEVGIEICDLGGRDEGEDSPGRDGASEQLPCDTVDTKSGGTPLVACRSRPKESRPNLAVPTCDPAGPALSRIVSRFITGSSRIGAPSSSAQPNHPCDAACYQ